nr:IS30 family transposase [Winogradskyella pacifica]
MTYDNGIEMAKHEFITQKTGTNIYFAHPYSSWERATNKNTNGLIRRYLPKDTNFNKIDQKTLVDIQKKLNNRSRK